VQLAELSFLKSCGLMLEPQEGMKVEDIVSWAEYAEKNGYGYLFRSDHILATSRKKGLDSPECWVTLGAVAARTNRINFGPMVSPIGFRNPALLAKMALTLHSYSKGRLILSVGAGWFEEEYVAHGFSFPGLDERRDQLKEALQIIRPLTEGKKVSFKGKHFSANLDEAVRTQSKVYLVVGGRDSKIIRLASESADELNLFSPDIKTVKRVKKLLGEKVVLSQMGPFFLGESVQDLESRVNRFAGAGGLGQDAKELISGLRERGFFCGTPDDFRSQIEEKRKLGVSKFYFQLQDPSDRAVVDTLTRTLRAM